MKRPRKVCVVTGTRAEYGLLYWLLKDLSEHPRFELLLAVTGQHLSPEFGNTVDRIEADGFSVTHRVDSLIDGDSDVAIAKSTGLGVLGFADALTHSRPDIVVVLGDRFETFAAAQAAFLCKIPLAHIHGGEVTEGALDDSLRHAITKLSHLHFVAAPEYRRRVIQMGEAPQRVFDVGAIGLDHLHRLTLLSREGLSQNLSFGLGGDYAVLTYHPATLGDRTPEEGIRALLQAVEAFPSLKLIFTQSNSDAGGKVIDTLVREYAAANPERVRYVQTLGQKRYLSAMKHAAVVIGNSSSGLIEAPALRVPTVDIGPRQRGRLSAASVIHCDEEATAIEKAIVRALSSEFRQELSQVPLPYREGDASRRILEELDEVNLEDLRTKPFYDLKD